MDNNDWRAAQGQVQIPGQVVGGEAVAAACVEGGDWRTQLQPDSRQRIVNKIMETLERHLPFSGQEGLQELKNIACRFEEKVYTAATSESDYLRKISLKILAIETESQNPMVNSLQSNGATSTNPQDPASQSMQSQMQNQVQQPSIPICNQSDVQQQLLSLNIQNNIASSGLPNSSGLTSPLPHVGGMSQGTMPNVPGTNPSMHNVSNVNPNAVGDSLGQGVPSNICANSQRQIQVRQQQVVNQEQQQPSQNSQYLYNQQLQQHLMKQKLQQGAVPQAIMQSQIQLQQQQQQTQNLWQQNRLQSSQQAVGLPSWRQSLASSTLQNQQPSLRQSTQSMLQQQSQLVLWQQQQQLQQPSVMHQQQTSMPQHSMFPTQLQLQQLNRWQSNIANMQQNELIGQPNSILEAQQQHQQQKMATQQNNISNVQPQQTISLQNNLANMHQQQSTGLQNSIPTMHQQQQMVGIQHGNSSLQTNQPPAYVIQQCKVSAQQQMQHSMANMLPNQAQQLQSRPMHHQLMLQIQSQQGQLQPPLGLPQKGTTLPSDMQQRIQTSPMLQQQITIDQQKQLLQSARGVPEVTPTSLDSSSQTSNVSGGDWQEEIYQKIKSMNEMYFPELNEMYQRVAAKLQQHDAHPQQLKNEQVEKLRHFKVMSERLIMFLQTEKQDIQPSHKEKIAAVDKQIVSILSSNRPQKNVSSLQQGLLAQPHTHAMQQPQQQQFQVSQIHTHDGQMNYQIQPMNVQGFVVTTQQNTLNSLQHNSLSLVSPLDSSSETSNINGRDWQEEIYQKIKSMNEMYFPELNEVYQRMAAKLQQHDAHPQQLKNEQVEKLRFFKVMSERLIMFLQTEKQDIQPSHKEKIAAVDNQIVNILSSNRLQKNVSLLQQGLLAQPHTHAMQQPQQQQPQVSQMHTDDNQMNSPMRPMNGQGSVVTTQQNTLNSLQRNSLSSVSGVQNSR